MKVTILSAERRPYAATTNRWAWHIAKRIEHDDGTEERLLHLIDPVVIVARAAEYDLDPNDIDTILDILMSEPHLTNEEYGPHRDDFLYNADDIATARTAHLKKTRIVKTRLGLSTKNGDGTPHPLDEIRHSHRAQPELHRLLKEQVQRTRESWAVSQRARASVMDTPGQDSTDRLLQHLQVREAREQARSEAGRARAKSLNDAGRSPL